MKTFRFLLVPLLLLFSSNMMAQSKTINKAAIPSANEVVQKATTQAAKEQKNVLLMFHASWCGWCHKMDDALKDPACKKMFDDRFVITHVTVLENAANKQLENPGGEALREKYNGSDLGIPFWVILDKNGTLLASSRFQTQDADGGLRYENIGCPATEPEVERFIDILKKITDLSSGELSVIADRFRKNGL